MNRNAVTSPEGQKTVKAETVNNKDTLPKVDQRGWTLTLTNADSEMLFTLDLSDFDLNKPIARALVMNEIDAAVARHARPAADTRTASR